MKGNKKIIKNKNAGDTTLSLKQQKKIADEYNDFVEKWTVDVPQEFLSNKKRFEDLVGDINMGMSVEMAHSDFGANISELILSFEEAIECIENWWKYSHLDG